MWASNNTGKRNLKLLPVLLLCSLLLIGIIYGLITNGNHNSVSPFLKDYDLLWKMLEEEYVFFPYVEDRNIEVDRLRERYREKVEENLDISTFESTLNTMFYEMGNIGHLSVVDYRGYELYCDHLYNEWSALLDNERVKKTYEEVLFEKYKHFVNPSFPEITFKYDSELKAAIIKIQSFDSYMISSDHDPIVDFLNSMANDSIENIVFDIRGNTGGDTRYWMNNIVSIFGENCEWQDTLFVKDTELARKYYFKELTFKPVSDLKESEIPGFVSKLGLTHYVVVDNYIAGKKEVVEKMCKLKRWILVDGQVYSAAESFVNFCQKTEWAETVGNKTRGDGIGSTPILIMLPESGLLIRFKLICPENSSGKLSIVYGTVPNYVSLVKEDPYDTLKRVIGASKLN